MELYAFYFLSFLSVFAALLVVFSKNPIFSVLYLVIAIFSIGFLYLLLSAEFLFAVNLIVYAGAIMVLFLYVIMHLNLNTETEPHKTRTLKILAIVWGVFFLIVLIGSLKGTELISEHFAVQSDVGNVKSLGKVLFTEFLLPFELASILLLAAMVGAVMLGKSETK